MTSLSYIMQPFSAYYLKRFIIKKLRYFMSLKYPRHTIVRPLISGPPYLPIANELKIIHY